MSGALVLPTYSRPELLEQCLRSIYGAERTAEVSKVVVVQPGNKAVEQLTLDYSDARTVRVVASPWDGTPMARAMRQFWLGVTVALQDPTVDWVMSVEEETVLAPDALSFTFEMFDRYSGAPAFRGVNLGSIEVDASLASTYSLLRYGFHGAGGALSRDTWRIAQLIAGSRRRRLGPFDCQVESYLKTGFMVTPNLSRYMNYGWIGGSNIPDTEAVRTRFARISESVEAESAVVTYQRREVRHAWREDCVPFRRIESPRYWARFLASLTPNQLSWARRAFRRTAVNRVDDRDDMQDVVDN